MVDKEKKNPFIFAIAQKKHSFVFAIGLFVGVIILLALRVQYYNFMELRPNMHPGLAFYFLPIIFPFILVFSVLIESLFGVYDKNIFTKPQTFFVGFLHASLLCWWVFPEHMYIFILVNPIVLRLIVTYFFKPNNEMEQRPSK